jgi:hypothetical protein
MARKPGNVEQFLNELRRRKTRNEPEFRQIVREMEANYQALHEKVGKWLEGNTYYNTY